jgi:hypothetical protein
VTATHDRQSDLDVEPAGPAWDERPIVGNVRGLPWWAAVLLAFVVAGAAAYVDIQRQGSLGRIYQIAYVMGCLVAIAWVRRRNLFGPMVQPPLVFAVTAVAAVVLAQPGTPFSSGIKQLVFSVALPLTSNFPTMGITTAAVVAVGLFRLWRQRDPDPPVRPSRSARAREAADAADAKESRRERSSGRGEPERRRQPDRGSGRARDEVDASANGPRPRGTREPDRYARDDDWDAPPRSGRGRPDPSAGERSARGDRRSAPPDATRRRRPDQDPDSRRRR